MFRFASKELDTWLKNYSRKPMVLRGARQVGKTWLVRDLAKRQHLKCNRSITFQKKSGKMGNTFFI